MADRTFIADLRASGDITIAALAAVPDRAWDPDRSWSRDVDPDAGQQGAEGGSVRPTTDT